MKLLRLIGGSVALLLVAAVLSLYAFHAAKASDHQDSPTVVANPMEDITDVFAFPDPANPANVVLAMDFYPLIPAGMTGNISFDPNVLYQFKIANLAASPDEATVIQMKAISSGTSPQFILFGPSAPNEVGTTNTLVKQSGTFAFNSPTTLSNGVQVFVGPRRDPFYFDLAQFFKIVPDRNYQNQPNPPPASASSFNFPSGTQPIILNGTSYGTAASNSCTIAQPSDLLQNYDVESFVIELPKTMLEPNGVTPGKIGLWATTATPSGQ